MPHAAMPHAPATPPSHEQWRSRTGFVLATIGAAVGLGNIWRFAYVAGENGGGAFLIVYALAVALIGLPLVIAELALGRYAQGDAVAPFERIAPGSRWPLAGWIGLAASLAILSYYAVVAGWALKYFFDAASGLLWRATATGFAAHFDRFIADPLAPVLWQAAMLALTMAIVAGGVQQGIERVNRVLMPLLALIVLGLAAYGLTLPGAAGGWRFLFAPDFAALSRPAVYLAALGQALFSLGVGMAVFITYGSYTTRAFSIPACAAAIVAGDTLFALVAGLAIFPAVFAFRLDPAAGPALAFITLPQLFMSMDGGRAVGLVFFLLLAAAALTSMVSLLEVPVSFLVHRRGTRRWAAVALVGAAMFALGIPAALGYGVLAPVRFAGMAILDAVDHGVSSYLLPLGGLLVAGFVGWRWHRPEALIAADFQASRLGVAWLWSLRILVPAAIALVLAMALAGS